MGAICSLPCKMVMKLYDCIEVIICCKCVTCAISTLKYLLAVINVLFIILGAVIGGIGMYLLHDQYMSDTYGGSVHSAAVGFIALGIFTVLLAIVGCIGARNYNKRALVFYMVCTFIIMIIQLVFGIEAAELAADGGVFAICVKRGTPAAPTVTGPDGTDINVNCQTFVENGLRVGSYALWQNVWNDAESYRCCKGSYWKEGTTTMKADNELTAPSFMAAHNTATRNCKKWTLEDAKVICKAAAEYESAHTLMSKLQEDGKCCGFGKPYKIGENYVNQTTGGVGKTTEGDGLGCVRNTQVDSLLPGKGSGNQQLQQCYGYNMETAEALPAASFPGKCNDNSGAPARATLYGLYCNWYAGANGPVSTCGSAIDETNPFGLYQGRCPEGVGQAVSQNGIQTNSNVACGSSCVTPAEGSVKYPQIEYQEYDFPMGDCPTLCYPFGCAQVIYEYVRLRLAGFSLIILLLVLVNTFGFFSACCLAVSHHVTDGQGDLDRDERRKLNRNPNTSERV